MLNIDRQEESAYFGPAYTPNRRNRTIGDLSMVSIITERNDIGRASANLQETQLDTSNVNVGSFGKVFERAVDGYIYAQPLYLPGVNIPGSGPRDVVYVATMHNSVYAFDAHNT